MEEVLDSSGAPYIERPDEHEVTGDQLFCWMHWNRECGGDCVAFEEAAGANPTMTACKLLNAARSISRSFFRLEQAADAFVTEQRKTSKKQAAVDLRAEMDRIPPPPKVSL
jgi:hypothetical protein